MRVALLGGPLDGSRVTWPAEGFEARFPIAEIVQAYGIRYGPGELIIAEATYRLLPHVGKLWSGRRYARHLAEP